MHQHGVLVDHGLVIHHEGGVGQLVAGQILPDDDHCQAGGSHVLLGAGVDDAVLGHIYGHGENVGGHVAHQRYIAGLGDIAPLGAVDGVVGAVVEVAGLGVQLQLVLGRDVGVVAILRGGGQVDLAELASLLIGQVGEITRHRIVGLSGFADEVEGNHRELAGGAGLKEQNLVSLRNTHNPAQLILGLLKNLKKDL